MEFLPRDLKGVGRIIVELLVIGGIGACAWIAYPHQIRTVLSQAYQEHWPCAQPVTYRIGAIDPRFKFSDEQVSVLLADAADKWNTAAGKTVLSDDPLNGTVVVNFIYDSRQENSAAMSTINTAVSSDQDSYRVLSAEYAVQLGNYQSKKVDYDAAAAAFDGDQRAFNQEIQSWNDKGGAPSSVYAQLQSKRAQLETQQSQLETQLTALNAAADEVNFTAKQINVLIDSLNLNVKKYDAVGAKLPGEFEEGLFTSSFGSEVIDIY